MQISIPAIAAVMSLAFSGGVHADQSSAYPLSRSLGIVYFGDLNIDSEQDAKILLTRIERAAARACGGHPTFSSYTGSLDNTFQECRDKAVHRAVKQLGAPALSRIYAERKPPQT